MRTCSVLTGWQHLGLFPPGIAHEIKMRSSLSKPSPIELEKSDDRELAITVDRELKRIDSMVSQMLRFASPGPPPSPP